MRPPSAIPISFRCWCSTRFSRERRASISGRASARRLRNGARGCIARSSSARLASSVGAGLLADRASVSVSDFRDRDGRRRVSRMSRQRRQQRWTKSRRTGVTDRELMKAKNQLRARLVFENDSVTNLGHQLGYFQTVASLDVYRDAPRLHRSRDAKPGRTCREEVPAIAIGGRSAGSSRPMER